MSTIDQLIDNLDPLLQHSVKEFLTEQHDILDQKNKISIARMAECWTSLKSEYEKTLLFSEDRKLKIVINSKQLFDEIKQAYYNREDEDLPCVIFCDFLKLKGYKPKHTRIMYDRQPITQHVIKCDLNYLPRDLDSKLQS